MKTRQEILQAISEKHTMIDEMESSIIELRIELAQTSDDKYRYEEMVRYRY